MHFPLTAHMPFYFSFSHLIWFNSGFHRFNLQMKNVVWHFIWVPWVYSGWPGFLMKRFEGPAARHYWHSLNTWDRFGVCNKLCCATYRTKLMCGDITFQHQSGLGFSIKLSTVPMILPKKVFTSLFLFCEWSVYFYSINSILSQSQRLNSDLWQMSSGYWK